MARKLLLALLVVALLLELLISFGCICVPSSALKQLRIAETPGADFLVYLVGWLCLFVSLICGLLLRRVWQRREDYTTHGYLLGCWWIGLGIGVYLAFGKPGNLLLDSLKGLLLVMLVNRAKAASRRR